MPKYLIEVERAIQSEMHFSIRPTAGDSEVRVQHARLDRDDASLRHADGWNGALPLLQQLLEEV